jgi:hypothetical protein
MGKQPQNALQTVARSGGRTIVALGLLGYAAVYALLGLIILLALRGVIGIFGGATRT